MVIIVCAIFQALATIFAAARFFCRIKLLDKLYADDWIILASLVRYMPTLLRQPIDQLEDRTELTVLYRYVAGLPLV